MSSQRTVGPGTITHAQDVRFVTSVEPISAAVVTLTRAATMDVTTSGLTFRWLSTSIDLEHVRRLTYACTTCGSDFKGTPEELGSQLPTHAATPCSGNN